MLKKQYSSHPNHARADEAERGQILLEEFIRHSQVCQNHVVEIALKMVTSYSFSDWKLFQIRTNFIYLANF
jgi:hypothetical protein